MQERPEGTHKSYTDLFRDEKGRMIAGRMTTSELITALGTEPRGTARYASLAAEAARRAECGAFPLRRVPAQGSLIAAAMEGHVSHP